MKHPRNTLLPYFFMMPALFLVVWLMIVPAIETVGLSFTEYRLIKPPRFIGLDNYIKFLNEPVFQNSLMNTFLWLVATLFFPVGLGLLIALLINQMPLENVVKSIFFVPLTLSAVATGFMWYIMYSPETGLLNTMLNMLGLSKHTHAWLTEVPLNTAALITTWTWRMTGRNMILFLVGLQAIPKSPIEAAMIDGAKGHTIFWHVILPLLKPTFVVVYTMAVINSLNNFDIIYILTQGGPYRSSETLAVTMYRESFTLFNMGYGSSISVLLSILVLAITGGFIVKNIRKESEGTGEK